MQGINPDLAANIVVTHFLASLMKIERERLGITRKTASREADWSTSTWGELERKARNMQPPHWIKAAEVLELGAAEVVRRLNAFVGKYPSVWFERLASNQYRYCERPITSPRAMRSGKVVNIELNQLRPNLYYELSTFSANPGEIIEQASALGFFVVRATEQPPRKSSRLPEGMDSVEAQRERLYGIIADLPDEKLGLLERVVDKFQRFSAKDLAHAYQHFSLSVSKR